MGKSSTKGTPSRVDDKSAGVFPNSRFQSAGLFFDQYAIELAAALGSINRTQLDLAIAILEDAVERDATIFTCGNGGSAAIANHMVCDHQKGINTDTGLQPKLISLSSNVELLTAVSNDISYAEVFAFPLRIHGRRGDVLVTVSSSGNSENIVQAIRAAKTLGIKTVALTGFDGGRSRKEATAAIHVDGWNYGVVEDAHQTCMHVMAQYIRHKVIPKKLLGHRRF
jgi:phosphoheptose isomerase